ncbi:hypothetical protein KAR91_71725 [Candidatus Pacearchaeota archaeon]|nr:hypothetical protein [Candidatus Pacearchaeota archaeon]
MRKAMEYKEQVTETEAEHTENLKELDTAAIEDPKLVNTVQERLDNLRKITDEKTAVSDEKDDDSTSDEIKDDSDAQESDQTESQTDSDDSTPEAETKDGEIKIPDAYIRAAIHQGWDKEVVDDLMKSNPELAKKTLENLYLSTNNASREWSELGRAKIEAERAKATQTATEAVVQEDPETKALIAKLRKDYVDDPLIEVVIKGLEKPVQQQPVKQPVQQQQQHYETATRRANAAANASTDQRVNTFFSAGVMAPYEKFYGKLELGQIPEDLTNGQQLNRLVVLEETECIIAGHNMRNQKIELEQAMEKAHFIVTEHIREQVIREKLKATATKRQKSMTLKPSDSKRTSDSMNTESSKPRNRKELENAVQQKLDGVFKK